MDASRTRMGISSSCEGPNRVAAGKVMEAISPKLPGLIGGSADLDPSTHTALKQEGDFENSALSVGDPQGSAGGGRSYSGHNLHFGVREHAMGAISNGLASHGGIIPFTATFLTFSDYMRPSIRIAALMGVQVIYVFTHDSIGLGEDGPTHQPIEQLASLRAMPELIVIRPCDANETAVAWRLAVETRDRPVALILTRQNVPTLDRTQHSKQQYEIGMVGLGVMGRNLLLNMADHGFSVAGYDKDPSKVEALRKESVESDIQGATNIKGFIGLLRKPRAVMMLVPAGAPVDSVINDLLPHLQPSDLIIDAGNSYFKDTNLRARNLTEKGIQFLGVGVSGGEEGGRGPSIMPGGPKEAYERVRPVFEAAAAKVNGDPCVTYLGPGSTGHFVREPVGDRSREPVGDRSGCQVKGKR
jgi:NAD binding domain of 6-phosphogluconate dehydrogenase/Transketolase, pyrimidine binding domain